MSYIGWLRLALHAPCGMCCSGCPCRILLWRALSCYGAQRATAQVTLPRVGAVWDCSEHHECD
eukprot:8141667-Alexandrium_andersonii.AAC.1